MLQPLFLASRFVYTCLAEVFSRVGTLILNDEFRTYVDRIMDEGVGRHSYVLSAEFEDIRRYDKALTLRYHFTARA